MKTEMTLFLKIKIILKKKAKAAFFVKVYPF